MSLTWDIFAKEVVKELGFHIPRALEYVKRSSDYHKTWLFLEICYLSITDELLAPFVRYCEQSHEVPSVSDYRIWNKESVNDANYLHLQQMISTFLHALILHRCWVRKCDALAMESGKAK